MIDYRGTWNLRVVPENKDEILARILKSTQVAQDDDESAEVEAETGEYAVINNTGLKEITTYLSLNGDNLSAYVVCPSGIMYQFSVNVMSTDFDVDWWGFAMRNYRVIVTTSAVKKKMADMVGVEAKNIKGKILKKGKAFAALDNCSLKEVFDLACPE